MCSEGEYTLYTHSLENLELGNAQVICRNADQNDGWYEFTWIPPRFMVGTADWTMRIIIASHLVSRELLATFWVEPSKCPTDMLHMSA